MTLTQIVNPDLSAYPEKLRPFLSGAKIYDSSCSKEAKVIFIDKDDGYFLKSAAKDKLARNAVMSRYFHSKNLSAEVLDYLSEDCDWLLTKKIRGDDCTAAKYLAQPEKLCDVLAELLVMLHAENCEDCPISDHTGLHLAKAGHNMRTGNFDMSHFPDNFGYKSADEAWKIVETRSHLIENDTLLHGDYCLPNIILDNWKFAGFIDLDNSGAGDRHFDIFWVTWSLYWNLQTDRYRSRFIDAYGRDKIDEEKLRIVAAIEVFT